MEQMLRIERDDASPGRTTLRLAGKLRAPDLPVLRHSLNPLLVADRKVEVDLAGLRFVDEPGARWLSGLPRRGVSLSRASGYVAELLRAVEGDR